MGLAWAFQETSSKVPSPRLRSRWLPAAISWKTWTKRVPDSGLLGDVGEGAVAVVPVELVGLAVAGVEGGGDLLARVEVAAHVEVEIAVAVVIPPGGDRGAAVGADPGAGRDVGEVDVPGGVRPVVVEELVGL